MTWQTNGPGNDGWEAIGTPITTEPESVPLPQTYRAYWFDPSFMGGLGLLIPSVGLTYGAARVSVRQQGARLEATLERDEIYGVALLDSFLAEILEGEPCSVLVTVYQDDRVTIAWEVSTDSSHPTPYLVEPDHYGEQELDVAKGSCSIGTVRVTVIDPAQLAGDQDSGWLTERLAELGLAALAGRRVRVVRFIDPVIGYQIIADGPAGAPQMDASYAAYQFAVRDTRETERKVRLTRGGDRQALPFGIRDFYGIFPGLIGFLLGPAGSLTETPVVTGFGFGIQWGAWGITSWAFDLTALGSAGREIPVEAFEDFVHIERRSDVGTGALAFTPAFPPGIVNDPIDYYTWIPSSIVVEFRLSAGPGPWQQIAVSNEPMTGAFDAGVVLEGTLVTGPPDVVRIERIHFQPNSLAWLDLISGAAIDVRILGGDGTISENLPFYIEGLTAGQFVANCYDGLYSPLGPAGQTVATGIRYDPAAVALMTDPVRLRLMEPVEDLRTWLEEHIYAPTGWIPALDFDGRIAPVSQNVPASTATLDAITNAIAEPAPEWTAGETVYNVIRFTYQRDYVPPGLVTPETIDGLSDREVILEYTDPLSIERHGRKVLDLAGEAFRSPGDANGAAFVAAGPEVAALLAQDRGTQLLNRYALGAPTVRLNVMRAALPLMRAGDWVVLALSWFPDYVTQRRDLLALGQVTGINDLDCAWRRVTVEVVNAIAAS